VARPVTRFTAVELRGILAAAAGAQLAAPARNDDFLDRFIDGVAECTGRLYGQPVYVRLLAAAGIARRPSAQTWVKAIGRARVRARDVPLPPVGLPASSAGAGANSVALAVLSAVTPGEEVTGNAPGLAAVDLVEWKARVQVAETTVRDAYARIAELESGRAGLIAQAAEAQAIARAAKERLKRAQRERRTEIAALLARLDTLAGALDRLSEMERHLRLQTDQLRQEMGQQAQFYKGRAEAAEKALADERSQTDAMRRRLSNRANTEQNDLGKPGNRQESA
jgi:hypothetical protein